MNNCMLMAEIVQPPQLRYTSDNQTPVAEFVVQFPGLREGDAPLPNEDCGLGQFSPGYSAKLSSRATGSAGKVVSR